MEYKKLFEPLTINGCTIPNRLAVTAVVVDLCTEEGYATERYINYQRTKEDTPLWSPLGTRSSPASRVFGLAATRSGSGAKGVKDKKVK